MIYFQKIIEFATILFQNFVAVENKWLIQPSIYEKR
jgi:hypothetical protein